MDQQEQMQFFYEIFDSSLPRLGPGDDASTRKALKMLLPGKIRNEGAPGSKQLAILDIGCGNGAQTIQLATCLDGTITAVDNHQPFLEELQRRAAAAGVSGRIRPCLKDMRALGMEKETFDLIWSEGALFVTGFRAGLATFRDLLRPNGSLAATDLCWLRPDPPEECLNYLTDRYRGYPAAGDIKTNLTAIQDCGYKVVGHFILPESAWLVTFYRPLEDRLRSLREKYVADPDRIEVIESIQMEIDIYRKYSIYYGYVFYLMQRC